MLKRIKVIIFTAVFSLILSLNTFAHTNSFSYTYDSWGKSIPAPNSYTVKDVICGESIGISPFESPQDLFVDKHKNIYIADTGNNRIVVLNSDYKFVKEIKEIKNPADGVSTFNKPQGVFVSDDNSVYVCDTDNGRVLKLSEDGSCQKIFTKPKTDLLSEKVVFKPTKIVVNSTGNIFIVAYGIYMGFICYNSEGEFKGFFGANKVEITPIVLARQFWKKIFTEEQNQSTIRILPTEYTNAFIDKDNFIYAVVLKSQTSVNELKKLNALGNNVLRFNTQGQLYPKNDFGDYEKTYKLGAAVDNRFVAVDCNDQGLIAMLDADKGHIFIYDKFCNLLFNFGRKGDSRGEFLQPNDIAHIDDDYLVLDSDKKSIVVFNPTPYASKVKKALTFYSKGEYIESKSMWEDILKLNSNFSIAYQSIGKAMYLEGNYKEAMQYFKYGNDRIDYSDAFREYRTQFIRQNFIWIILAIIIIFFVLKFLLRKFKLWLGYSVKTKKIIYK